MRWINRSRQSPKIHFVKLTQTAFLFPVQFEYWNIGWWQLLDPRSRVFPPPLSQNIWIGETGGSWIGNKRLEPWAMGSTCDREVKNGLSEGGVSVRLALLGRLLTRPWLRPWLGLRSEGSGTVRSISLGRSLTCPWLWSRLRLRG